MPTISLLTDFGLEDNFVGVMKAVILKINPSVTLVDICHNIKPQDIREAAFLLRSSYKFFPSGTVHLVVVDPGVGSRRKKILVKTKDYFFVGPDNGVLALALKDDEPLKIIEITNERYFLKRVCDTFHGRDIFAPVAAYLSKGIEPENFGKQINSYSPLELPQPKLKGNQLIGEIIYIDHFGNIITDIDRETFKNFIRNKKFKIFIKGKIIDKLSHSYSEGQRQEPLVLIDSFDFLEIAINSHSASKYLRASQGDIVNIKREL